MANGISDTTDVYSHDYGGLLSFIDTHPVVSMEEIGGVDPWRVDFFRQTRIDQELAKKIAQGLILQRAQELLAQELRERVLPPKNHPRGWLIPSTQWEDVAYLLSNEATIEIFQRGQPAHFLVCLVAKTNYYPSYPDLIIAKYYLIRFKEKQALKRGNIIYHDTERNSFPTVSQRFLKKALNLKTKRGGKNKWARCTSSMLRVIAPLLGRLPLKRRNRQP